MFDIAPSEFLLVAVVAIVFIGPKDLPMALRTAGRWIARMRRVSNHFRSGIETMIREAEMEELERKWREQNAEIMAANPAVPETTPAPLPDPAAGQTVAAAADQHDAVPHAVPVLGSIDPVLAAHAPTEPDQPLSTESAAVPHTDKSA
ncbi:Sec-independent protein secretion pathway component [Novosphingobium nitrogenifigens DSM 19370]|uniref:Sec-independent protein secretion pathway component n=1 Tax=Novosphingobium nitrogenifigens DSM 19370 TaxID=983920 RepID=F1ZD91_9SPHN|nr:Sec-independent protein translocase protein TatB [Novosphingobium nitrogenifigens]EGD57314.1 Sec-independent protein secretion pathway component [Novosphingobium nitrogenifigens DSM 19370]